MHILPSWPGFFFFCFFFFFFFVFIIARPTSTLSDVKSLVQQRQRNGIYLVGLLARSGAP
jgi:hypothetical protein